MTEPAKVVAIIAANEALTAILSMVVIADPSLRVRQFESAIGLRAYMRIAPIHMLVCDFDNIEFPADRLVYALRRDEAIINADFAAIALTRTVTAEMRHTSIRAGIDEVIVKPMSPRHLLARVQSRLRAQRSLVSGENGYRGPDRRNRVAFGVKPSEYQRRGTDNVVPLFPERRTGPKHPGLHP